MAKEGIKFLLWAYFGLGENESKENIIGKCIDLAYTDATNQGSFNTRADNTQRNSQADRDILDAVLNWEITDYDSWHERICDKLVRNYSEVKRKNKKDEDSDRPAFTYGNAQKWVNMTVKYLYLFRSTLESFDENCSAEFCEFYDARFADHEESFHVPIDSFIIEALWPKDAQEGECDWLPGAKFTRNNKPYLGPYSSTHYTPWSNFTKEEYIRVRDHVREVVSESGKSPLEWENENWIKIAKKRKQQGER